MGDPRADGLFLTDELDAMVHVATKDALSQLVQRGQLDRLVFEGRYLYCAPEVFGN